LDFLENRPCLFSHSGSDGILWRDEGFCANGRVVTGLSARASIFIRSLIDKIRFYDVRFFPPLSGAWVGWKLIRVLPSQLVSDVLGES
jgi:hypothetical protein